MSSLLEKSVEINLPSALEEKQEPLDEVLPKMLGSLSQAKKYFPKAVDSFLSSVEGKSTEELKLDIQTLAKQADEKALAKTSDYKEEVKDLVGKTTNKVKSILPSKVQNILEHIETKSVTELKHDALSITRKNLLSSEKDDDDPSLSDFAGEIKEAATSGVLLDNILNLSEKAVETQFGPIERSENADTKSRLYSLTWKLTSGIGNEIKQLARRGLETITTKVQSTTGKTLEKMDEFIRTRLAPFADRFGTPILSATTPFIVRFSVEKSKNSAKKTTTEDEDHILEHEEKAIPPTQHESGNEGSDEQEEAHPHLHSKKKKTSS